MITKDSEIKIKQVANFVQSWSRSYVERLIQADTSYDFQPASMDCMCAYTSTVLLECLHWLGFKKAILHSNEYHVFICYEELLIDITACQFSDKFQEIEVTPLDEFLTKEVVKKYCESYWEKKQTYLTVEDAYHGLHHSSPVGFPSSQYFRRKQELFDAINSAKLYIENSICCSDML